MMKVPVAIIALVHGIIASAAIAGNRAELLVGVMVLAEELKNDRMLPNSKRKSEVPHTLGGAMQKFEPSPFSASLPIVSLSESQLQRLTQKTHEGRRLAEALHHLCTEPV